MPLAGAFRCKNHPDRDGVGICVPCKRVVCADCSTRLDGINHCRECLEAKLGKARRAPSSGRKAFEKVAAAGFVLVAFAALIGVFYLIGAGASGVAWFGAGRSLAKTAANMDTVARGLKQFRRDVGRFPSEREGLAALLEEGAEPIPGWSGPYLMGPEAGEGSPLEDGYGNALHYVPGPPAAIVSPGGNRTLDTDLAALRPGDPGDGDDRVVWIFQ